MRFTKMNGLGNDYVFVDSARCSIVDPAAMAVRVADRHRGIGADGLILIGPSSTADVRMRMYNADGSHAEMCGNGIRCVALFAIAQGYADGPALAIETDAGVRSVWCRRPEGPRSSVRVNMGPPSFAPADMPADLPGDRIIDHPLSVDGHVYAITCVSMGNPHAVVFVDDLGSVELEDHGKRIEHAPVFPQRINAHFACALDREHIAVRSWERGSGETRACGTGACAACVASSLTGRTERAVTVHLPGGDLEIEWANDVYMTGPAEEVFTGDWPGYG